MRVKKYIYVGFGWAKNWFPFFFLQGVGNYGHSELVDSREGLDKDGLC